MIFFWIVFVTKLKRNEPNSIEFFLAGPRFDYENLGSHCLDLLHKSYIGFSEVERYKGELCREMRPASYLHGAGITTFRLSEGHPIHNISFHKGKLKLSKIHIH